MVKLRPTSESTLQKKKKKKEEEEKEDKKLLVLLPLLKLMSKTQEIRKNAFNLDKTGQNAQSFEEVLFFKLRTT